MTDRPGLIRSGDHRAMAALMRDLEDQRPGARDDLRAAVAGGAAPFVVGVTGPPGAGKSTLADALLGRWRARGQPVGVVAVDPSSPLAGGAVLGDRVRMQRHATDAGVFIRSLASRGASGGLSAATADVIAVLAAGGFSTILVETVGVGQAEVDVTLMADVALLVTVPGLGDDIQMMKAGLLEAADLLVLNKADRPGADQALADLRAMLELRRASGGGVGATGGRAIPSADVPILRTVATTGEGLDELVAALDAARAEAPAGGAVRRRRRAEMAITRAVATRVAALASAVLAPGGSEAALSDEVGAGRMDPQSAAEALMSRLPKGY